MPLSQNPCLKSRQTNVMRQKQLSCYLINGNYKDTCTEWTTTDPEIGSHYYVTAFSPFFYIYNFFLNGIVDISQHFSPLSAVHK